MSVTLEENFATAAGAQLPGAPDWFNALRREAHAAYTALPWPSRQEENWRFGRPKNAKISEIPFASEEGAVMDLEPASAGIIRLTFLNGYCLSVEGEIPDGLVALPLNRALEETEGLLARTLPAVSSKLGSEKLAALHRAQLEDGVLLYVKEGVKVEQPIEILNLFTGAGRSQSALYLHAEKDAQISVYERFVSTNEKDESVVLSVCDIVAHPEAQISYLCSQELNRESQLIRLGECTAQESSLTQIAVLHFGAKWVRDEFYSTLAQKEARSYMMSIAIPNGEQEYDQRTFQHHLSPHCYSDLVYKNVLYDRSKTTFSGLIFVDEGAHHTDAYQTCRNLLMSDTCEANSMPGLEINADQVSCSHGSTSSQVSREEIFYLQARGIPEEQSKQLIAEGFCADALKNLDCQHLQKYAKESLDAYFSGHML